MSLDRAVFWSCSRKCLRSVACLCVKLLFGSVFLRVMNVVKTYLFFSARSLKLLMHLSIMHFLSSIEIHLLKVT